MIREQKQKAITLISMVVTIVILLILAGVTIGTIVGENGLLAKVNQAKKAQIEAEMKENLTLAITELQTEKEGKATLDDITQEWANSALQEYETKITTDASINGKKIKMTKSNITGNYIIDEKLSITEIENEGSIEFSYEVKEIVQYKAKVSIHIQDKENGIDKIEFPDGGIIECFGRAEYVKDNYEVEVGIEYKIKITSKNGETKEEIIYIEPEIEMTEPIIGTANPPTSSVADNSRTKGTTLYINFSATLKGTNCTITLKDDTSKTMPYAVTSNGKYIFTVTGICNGKTISEDKEVIVKKYQGAKDLVQYDAGEWTKEEIEELQSKSLYDINTSHTKNNTYKLISPSGLNFTFGGFTYKGDTTNASNISNGAVITSRNKSVAPESGCGTPKYDGWQILDSYKENGKTYITKLVHAGSPENFVMNDAIMNDGHRAEYLLSSGLIVTSYSTLSSGETINPRSWQMYIDKNQRDLIADTIDKDGNSIKDIHAITMSEMMDSSNNVKAIGSNYWIAICYGTGRGLEDWNETYSSIGNGTNNCYGIRPVVSLKSGVYIKSGDGIEGSPYILGIEE